MKTIDAMPQAFASAPASPPNLKPASRLIVLVPETEAEPAILARKLRELAKALESRIQLLGLSPDAAYEPSIRRRLVTLSSLVEDTDICVETTVEIGNNWLGAIQSHWHNGDVIVCFAEHYVEFSGRSIYKILESKLEAPVYLIAGLDQHLEPARPSWGAHIAAWAGSAAVLLAFFALQYKIVQLPQGSFRDLLLYATIFAESGSIWAWNHIAC